MRLDELMLRQVARCPDRVAVFTSSVAWTYQKLGDKTREFAAVLARGGVGAASQVALCLSHGPAALAVLAACSSLGATAALMDPGAPRERLAALLRQVEPDCVVAEGELALEPAPARACWRVRLRGGEVLEGEGEAPARTAARAPGTPAPAYIVFTSGTTGRPKGIVMSHGAATAFIEGLIDFYGLAAGEVYASCSPLHFDFALLDMGLCLGAGGSLFLPERGRLYKPRQLAESFRRVGAAHVSGVPTIWKLLLRHAAEEVAALTGLRRIVFAGEHFPIPHIEQIYGLLPAVEIVNIYGQSESIACTFHVLPRPLPAGCTVLPVGEGHRDLQLFLVDDAGGLVTEAGQLGELYLSGKLLFDGYLRDPEETRRRLVPSPVDRAQRAFRSGDLCYRDAGGMLYFVGRKDHQVQIFGNRVEPEEIEGVIGGTGAVDDVCVVHEQGAAGAWLHAFAVPAAAAAAADVATLEADLRRRCAERLPGYMVPNRFHFVERLPLSANGKVDRNALLASLGS